MRFPSDVQLLSSRCLARGICALLAIVMSAGLSRAQTLRTATPVRAELKTATPLGYSLAVPTVTVPPSATQPGPALVEARESAGRVNVRALPDPNSDILGTIASGTQYLALRRYYLWIELGFDAAPGGRAWVFSELVDLSGNIAGIVDVDDYAAAVATLSESEAESTVEKEPADAGARTLLIATSQPYSSVGAGTRSTPLPTFTYPPGVPRDLPTRAASVPEPVITTTGPAIRIPPLAPIVVMAGLGLAGLIISGIRQL